MGRRLVVTWTQMSLGSRSRMTRTRPAIFLLVLVSTASAQINFGGGSSDSRPSSSSGGQRPSSGGSSSRPSSGSSIQFANKNPSGGDPCGGCEHPWHIGDSEVGGSVHNASEDGWNLPIHLRTAVQAGFDCNLDTGRDIADHLLPSTGNPVPM